MPQEAIIGLGVSGLAAAVELAQAGVPFIAFVPVPFVRHLNHRPLPTRARLLAEALRAAP